MMNWNPFGIETDAEHGNPIQARRRGVLLVGPEVVVSVDMAMTPAEARRLAKDILKAAAYAAGASTGAENGAPTGGKQGGR